MLSRISFDGCLDKTFEVMKLDKFNNLKLVVFFVSYRVGKVRYEKCFFVNNSGDIRKQLYTACLFFSELEGIDARYIYAQFLNEYYNREEMNRYSGILTCKPGTYYRAIPKFNYVLISRDFTCLLDRSWSGGKSNDHTNMMEF